MPIMLSEVGVWLNPERTRIDIDTSKLSNYLQKELVGDKAKIARALEKIQEEIAIINNRKYAPSMLEKTFNGPFILNKIEGAIADAKETLRTGSSLPSIQALPNIAKTEDTPTVVAMKPPVGERGGSLLQFTIENIQARNNTLKKI